jgi:hypothetical protein
VTLADKVRETIKDLNPKLDELADGYVELLGVDEGKGTVKLKLIGGRLH